MKALKKTIVIILFFPLTCFAEMIDYKCYQPNTGIQTSIKTENLESIGVFDFYFSNNQISLDGISYDTYAKMAVRIGEGGAAYYHVLISRDNADGVKPHESVFTTLYCRL